MTGKVIIRLDDVTPGLDERNFERVMSILRGANVRPLLGLVPDNRDPELNVQRASDNFWIRIRRMVDNGEVDIAQHGYRHLLYKTHGGILNRVNFLSPLSEFAGRSYDRQFDMIRKGQELLRGRGLSSDIWMAPNHSFDQNTLRALKALGFTRVTDGVGLYPYRRDGLLFVPQQLWRARNISLLGIWTVCLHTNGMTEPEIHRLAEILPRLRAISFPDASIAPPGKTTAAVNMVFRWFYGAFRAVRKLLTPTPTTRPGNYGNEL